MSYYLMVFDPAAAPVPKADFLVWFDKQTEWGESHSYDDPSVTTPNLRQWYHLMVPDFPPMNGPDSDDSDSPRISDYSIGRSIIYVAFASSQAEVAYQAARAAAAKAGVGVFKAGGRDAEIWLPGQTEPVAKSRFWRRILNKF